MSNPKRGSFPTVDSTWVSSLTLRTKLLSLILGVACSLVITLTVLGLEAIKQTSETAQAISRTTLESQTKNHMIKVTEENAGRNALILDQTMAEADLLAAAAAQYFAQPDLYGTVGQMQGETNLQLMNGRHVEGPTEKASIYIPDFVDVNESITRQVQIGRLLDPLALAVLERDTKATAVYFITTKEVTRYYPKGNLDGLPVDFRATEQFFFTNVVPAVNPERQNRWTTVYDDPAGQGLMVSAIAPVYASDEFVGIVGVDFRLGDLGEAIESATLAEGSYSFLIDSDANTIAYPDQAYDEILGRTRAEGEFSVNLSDQGSQFGEVVAAMTSGKSGISRVSDTGAEKFIAYTPLGDAGWSLATVVSTETILGDINLLEKTLTENAAQLAFKKLVPLGIIILFIVTTMAFFFAYRFTSPLRQLTTAAAAIGRREWDVEMPKIRGEDEVGILSRTIADMAIQLQGLIGSLETRVNERTSALSDALGFLKQSNDQLSTEIDERKKSDAARADLEARFTHAFQNAPIGMALMDMTGRIQNPNPQLKNLFWPSLKPDVAPLLETVVVDHERDRFHRFMRSLNGTTISDEFSCKGYNGKIHQIVFFLTTVENEENIESYIVLLAQDVTEARDMTELLQHQANHDELTGLQNRRAFSLALQSSVQACSESNQSHLLFLDLDQFKIVNDTCGHSEGDRLLIEVTQLITSCVRSSDLVARIGGDEFAILLAGCNKEVAFRKAEQIREAVQNFEFYSASDLFKIGVSIGLVSIKDSDIDLSELQQLADAACYAAKEAGRNRVYVLTDNNDKVKEQRGDMRWVQRLRDAMQNNKFVLFGQKFQQLRGENERGHVEILVRLRETDTQNIILPGAFLPAAERYGLMVELDKWVVSSLLETLAESSTLSIDNQFWVNLSGSSLGDPEFCDFLLNQMKACALAPGTVNFEITETVVIKNMANAKKLIADLRRLGCRIALDDFGSGLSSLLYLKTLEIDCVKIDGSFVKDIVTDEVDRIFVKSTIEIANQLGIKTIAEYVENDEIRDVVASLGADYAQGFGIHHPEELHVGVLPFKLCGNG